MSDTNLFVGRKIGQYTITSFIANGGMADVYQAIDKGLDREVALKLLFPQYSRNKEFTERFQREARSAAKLRHPNIVQVYATGETDQGDQYIAMEYVNGGTLEDKLTDLAKEGKLIETNLVLLLMLQIADALRVAHESGIVHRDLKPSNILLRKDINSPVLTDLGIAISTSEARLTQTNKMMGTPDYMSPEQAVGGEMDGRSDVYSFGVMLYELLCGRRPFGGDSPWVIVHKQINEEPTPLEKIRPGLTPLVYEVIERCMQKKPEDRFQSTGELVKVLTLAAQVEGVNAESTGQLSTVSLTSAGVNPPSGALSIVQNSAAHPLVTRSTGAHTPQRGPRWGLVGVLVGLVAVISGVIAFLIMAVPPQVIRITAEPPQAVAAIVSTVSTSESGSNQSATIMPTSTRAPATVTPEVIVVTATPEPTLSPTPTASLAPTETPEPTASGSGGQGANNQSSNGDQSSNPAILTTGNGLPIRFEGSARWGIGEEKNGSLQNTTERSYSGTSSGRLDYTFTTDQNDYVVFLQVNPISGTPNTVSAWVYGDGSGHFINAWILDEKQQVWQVPLGQVFHTGWQEMTGSIQVDQDWPWSHISGPDNNKIDYPIQFYAVVLDDFNGAYVGDGTIFIDDIHVETLDAASLPTIQPVEPTSTPEGAIVIPTETSTESVEPTTESVAANVGRIIYMSGDQLFTTDPAWSAGNTLGTAENSSCSGTPTLTTGESFNVYRGFFCPLAGPSTCTSPNGQTELLINIQGSRMTVNVRAIGDSSNGEFIYDGSVDKDEGMRWSPDSQSFIWVTGDTMFRGFAAGSYQQLYGPIYNPIISPDSQSVLYRKPVGPGVNDVWVAKLDGSGETNVTNNLSADKSCAVWATGN